MWRPRSRRIVSARRAATLSLLVIALVAVGVSVVAWRLHVNRSALDRLRTAGTIRIGYAVENPYAYVSPNGRVTGESPEIARLVVARMGIVHIEWVQTSFDALIADLQEGRFDVIGAGMFITPDRAKAVAFAAPSLRVREGLLVRAGNPRELQSYGAAIADAQVRVAALAGSVEARRLAARGLPAARLLIVPDAATGRAAVGSGAVDALALSYPTVRQMASESSPVFEAIAVRGAASATDRDGAFEVAFAVSKDHPALLAAWNAAQASLIHNRAYLRAIEPFGFGLANLPIPKPSTGGAE